MTSSDIHTRVKLLYQIIIFSIQFMYIMIRLHCTSKIILQYKYPLNIKNLLLKFYSELKSVMLSLQIFLHAFFFVFVAMHSYLFFFFKNIHIVEELEAAEEKLANEIYEMLLTAEGPGKIRHLPDGRFILLD